MANPQFNAGVAPGGLRQQQEIELLVGYLLSSLHQEVSRDILYEAIAPQGLANYFGIGQAISSLMAHGNVTERKEGEQSFLTLTEQGCAAVGEIETALPYAVRQKALSAALLLLARARNAAETEVIIQKDDPKNVLVTCTVREKEKLLMSLTVLVADELQALQVEENFRANPSLVYGGVLALLAGKPQILLDQMEEV